MPLFLLGSVVLCCVLIVASKEEERSGSAEERMGVDGRRPGAESGQVVVVEVHARNQSKWSHSVSRLYGHWQFRRGEDGRVGLGFSRSHSSTRGPMKHWVQLIVWTSTCLRLR